MKTADSKAITNLPRLNDVSRFNRSIIEDWKNPSKFYDDILRSDQLYEERAIDVPNHPFLRNYSKTSNDASKPIDDKKTLTRNKPSNNGTVRSIPIKHYQASIAHNMGTLRRSTATQSQFESSISEPEKNHSVPKYKTANDATRIKNESNVASQVPRPVHFLKHSDIVNATRRSCHSCDYQREAQTGGNKVNSKLKTLDRRIVRSEHNISTRDDEDVSDFEEYFHKSSRAMTMGRLRSNEARHQFSNDAEGNGVIRLSKDEENRLAKKWGTIDLQRGNVGQKISAYEENARRSGRNWEYSDRYQVLPEITKHRTIGVPLVGMHNACGLPVVASWSEHELLEPLRVRSRVIGTLRPIFKTPRTSDGRHRTHPKRRAPQPSQIMSRKKYEAEKMKSFDKQVEYPSIKSLVSLDPEACEARKRRRRRPSFKAKKIGTFSSKNSMRHTCKSHIKRNKENSMAESARKVYQDENCKRQTLYARDDGDDAVQVLKNLCLNPLARTKSESDMIW